MTMAVPTSTATTTSSCTQETVSDPQTPRRAPPARPLPLTSSSPSHSVCAPMRDQA